MTFAQQFIFSLVIYNNLIFFIIFVPDYIIFINFIAFAVFKTCILIYDIVFFIRFIYKSYFIYYYNIAIWRQIMFVSICIFYKIATIFIPNSISIIIFSSSIIGISFFLINSRVNGLH